MGQNFAINISILNVNDLFGWQLKIGWNTTILDAINATEGPFLKNGGSTFFSPSINNSTGYAILDCTLLGNVSGVSGSGTLAIIQFHVKAGGNCDLNLYDTTLLDSSEQSITHIVEDGHFKPPLLSNAHIVKSYFL